MALKHMTNMKLRNIDKEEFIGRKIKVVDAANKSLIGIQGTVIDETKNLLIVSEAGKKGARQKKLLKSQIVFTVKVYGRKFEINGNALVARPEERIILR